MYPLLIDSFDKKEKVILNLKVIYESIQEDLDKVEDRLQSLSRIDNSHLSELLDYSL